MQLLRHTKAGVAYIGAVQERDGIEEEQERNNASVNFAGGAPRQAGEFRNDGRLAHVPVYLESALRAYSSENYWMNSRMYWFTNSGFS